MRVVAGLDALEASGSPAFVVVGVFDGLHLGHAYLLEHLVREAAARSARPVVITFDHHPDEVLTGSAPPLLCDPDERIERLAAAGVETTVVVHFDQALRETPYDRFVDRLEAGTPLAGFLMTPDAAFGYERAGTPASLGALGASRGWDVVVVPAFDVDGRPVRSTQIRTAIAEGDLDAAQPAAGSSARGRGRARRGRGGSGRGERAPVCAPRRPSPRWEIRRAGGPGFTRRRTGRRSTRASPPRPRSPAARSTVAGPARIGRTRVAFTARR